MSGTTTSRTNRVPPVRLRLTTIGVGAGAAGGEPGRGGAGCGAGAGAGARRRELHRLGGDGAEEGVSCAGSRAAADLLGVTLRRLPDAIRS